MSKGPFLLRSKMDADSRAVIERFGVRTPSEQVPAFALSGGNQQKLIVGREMASKPKVLLAAHPTRGVDVGAQAAIWDELRSARDAGLGVVLISADLEELIGLSDRILVMGARPGRIVTEIGVDLDRPRTVAMMTSAPFTERKRRILELLHRGEGA